MQLLKCTNMENQITRSIQTTYTRDINYISRVFEVLQTFRNVEVFCDVKLETEDGTVVSGHKVILASASPYFREMFSSFTEEPVDRIIIEGLNSVALKLLIDFMYGGQIIFTEDNVENLLSTSILLQLHDVQKACCGFLRSHLNPENCLGIKALADKHKCLDLLSSSESYIKQNFSKVVKSDSFQYLLFEQIVKLISSDEITVQSEEIVFECVVKWVNADSSSRENFFPKLLEHIRLPLLTKEYLLKTVAKEPLINNRLECLNYMVNALGIQILKYDQPGIFQNTVCTTPRRPVGRSKFILVIGGCSMCSVIEWYDPITSQWQSGPEIKTNKGTGFAVLKNGQVFSIGGRSNKSTTNDVHILFNWVSTTPYWALSVSMMVKRSYLGVAVLNYSIYAIGGYDGKNRLNSAEVFDASINCTQGWRTISSMSTRRSKVGVGILDNRIYAVGGHDGERPLKSVERYNPDTDKWTFIPEMCLCRSAAGVGILNGLLYVVGGSDEKTVLNSVEMYNPSTKVWTFVANMKKCRKFAGVVSLNGLLYVVGGFDGTYELASVEVYNPTTNSWFMIASMFMGRSFAGVFSVDKPPHLND